jgi:hypothetical protein
MPVVPATQEAKAEGWFETSLDKGVRPFLKKKKKKSKR